MIELTAFFILLTCHHSFRTYWFCGQLPGTRPSGLTPFPSSHFTESDLNLDESWRKTTFANTIVRFFFFFFWLLRWFKTTRRRKIDTSPSSVAPGPRLFCQLWCGSGSVCQASALAPACRDSGLQSSFPFPLSFSMSQSELIQLPFTRLGFHGATARPLISA